MATPGETLASWHTAGHYCLSSTPLAVPPAHGTEPCSQDALRRAPVAPLESWWLHIVKSLFSLPPVLRRSAEALLCVVLMLRVGSPSTPNTENSRGRVRGPERSHGAHQGQTRNPTGPPGRGWGVLEGQEVQFCL